MRYDVRITIKPCTQNIPFLGTIWVPKANIQSNQYSPAMPQKSRLQSHHFVCVSSRVSDCVRERLWILVRLNHHGCSIKTIIQPTPFNTWEVESTLSYYVPHRLSIVQHRGKSYALRICVGSPRSIKILGSNVGSPRSIKILGSNNGSP